ncbi:Uncharacterized protein PBTT_09680 [Plasmodiophora brassicae]
MSMSLSSRDLHQLESSLCLPVPGGGALLSSRARLAFICEHARRLHQDHLTAQAHVADIEAHLGVHPPPSMSLTDRLDAIHRIIVHRSRARMPPPLPPGPPPSLADRIRCVRLRPVAAPVVVPPFPVGRVVCRPAPAPEGVSPLLAMILDQMKRLRHVDPPHVFAPGNLGQVLPDVGEGDRDTAKTSGERHAAAAGASWEGGAGDDLLRQIQSGALSWRDSAALRRRAYRPPSPQCPAIQQLSSARRYQRQVRPPAIRRPVASPAAAQHS